MNYRQKIKAKLTLGVVTGLSLAVIVLGYAGYKMKDVFRGPKLTLSSPNLAALPLPSELVTISGQATRVAHLRLNDGQIFADSEGKFAEKLLLAPGYNIIKLEARDRFGRVRTELLELTYQAK
ncbi:MAG: hypothetical protein AAB364_03380 [Patescibacteria group bacterium]